jgi:hypothetical protein
MVSTPMEYAYLPNVYFGCSLVADKFAVFLANNLTAANTINYRITNQAL